MTTATVQRESSPPSGELSHRQILTILVGLLLGMFLAALDQTVVSTAIRTIADDLGGLSEQAWATTAFLITSTITTPLYGKLSDIYGRKPLFLLAISIFLVGSVTCTFAESMYQLAAFRALQGIGAGGLFSLALTILGDIVPPRERARYQGLFLAVFGTSSVLGPVIGGLLSGANQIMGIAGWRWIFLVNVPIGLVALVVVAKVLNVPHVPRGRARIDWPGAIMLAVGLVPLLIVAEQGRTWGWASTASFVCYGIGVVGLILFVLIERWYRDDALLPLRLFRNSVFSLVTVIGVIVGMGMFGGIAVLPQFLQIVRGASPIESGFLMLPLVAGIMIASIASGQLTSRTGRYKVFPVVGTLLMTSALVILYFRLNVDIPFWELDLYMAMFGLGLGGCMQTLVLAVQNASPARDMGVVTASSTFFRQLGGTVGTAVFFSILFSTLPDQIKSALTTASKGDPAFQAAVADPAVHANPVNQPFFALAQSTGGSSSNVLSDSAFLQTIDARLAHPILVGFSNSITLVFLVAACVIAVAFLLVLFVKELPLRTMSGARAAAMEEAAAASEVPAAVAAEAIATETGPAVPDGRHALAIAAGNGTGHGTGNGNGYGGAHNGQLAAAPLSGPGVVGTVRRGDGHGLPEVVVTVADAAGHQEARGATDHQGRYAVALREEGTYLVVAAAGNYQPHAALVGIRADTPTVHDVTMSGTSGVYGLVKNGSGPVAGPTVERDLDLPQRSRLVGTVNAAGSGWPVADATATLVDAGGAVVASMLTGPDGEFTFDDLPAGTYTLTARGYSPVAQTVHVQAGVQATADVTLGSAHAHRPVEAH